MTALEEVVDMGGSMMIHIAVQLAQISAGLAPALIMEGAGALSMTAMVVGIQHMIVPGVPTMVTGVPVMGVTGGNVAYTCTCRSLWYFSFCLFGIY